MKVSLPLFLSAVLAATFSNPPEPDLLQALRVRSSSDAKGGGK